MTTVVLTLVCGIGIGLLAIAIAELAAWIVDRKL